MIIGHTFQSVCQQKNSNFLQKKGSTFFVFPSKMPFLNLMTLKRFVLFFFSCSKKKGESIIMTHQEIGIYEINRISYLGKGYMYWIDTCLFLYIE